MNKNPRGYIALLTVLIISAVALSTASTVSLLAIGEAQTSLAQYKGEENLQLVEGCVEDALLKAWASSTYNGGNITRPEGTCIITVAKAGNNWTITITTTATSYNRTVQVEFSRTTGIVMNSWNETLSIPTPTPIPGRVGHWKFDDGSPSLTAVDSSGNGNNGTLTGVPTWTAGKFGQALLFDGVNDYINLGTDTDFYFNGTKPFTIAVWFKRSGGSGDVRPLLSRYNAGVLGNWYFIVDNNSKIDGQRETSPSTHITGSTTLGMGVWYHGAYVYDGTNLKLYLNGISDATPVASGNIAANQSNVSLFIGSGQSAGAPGELFPGTLDDVRIYNRALSVSEITAIYNGAP